MKGSDERMSAETIVNKIKSDAQQKVKEIKKEAKRKRELIIEDATEEAKTKANEIKEKGKQQAELKKKIMISQAHQQAKRNEMNAKEDIIETCFKKAIDHLANIDETSYKKLVKQLIKQGKKELSGNKSTLKISNDFDKHLASEMNIEVTGETGASGGVIFQSEQGTITIDNTFEGILKREKQRIRVKVGQLLFKEENNFEK